MRRVVLIVVVLGAVFVPIVRSGAAPGPNPVILIPGWHGNPASFGTMIPVLESAGIPVLDFDPGRPGAQALSYAPTADGQHIPYIAGKIVGDAIEAALARAGYGPDQHVDMVGYSMGGLVARFLIEQPGADVEEFSVDRGWFGDGVPDVAGNWADRVDTLVMSGTPNHGAVKAWVPGTIGGYGPWNASGGDMRPGSAFLRRMGTAEPAGERYVTIGGAPRFLPFPQYDYDGDGVFHGHDGLVPSESPFLTGSEHYLVPVHHNELVTSPEPVNLVVQALGRSGGAPPGGGRNLVGSATIRLERAAIGEDHDWGTADDFNFDVSVDSDGGNDSYVTLGGITYQRDAPFDQNWGDAGPIVGPLTLPGTSPRLDVRLDVWEHDSWRHEVVTTAVFRDVMLSDDLDGMDYYEVVVPLAQGRRHVFRISLNGVSSRP
jgi:hypothetical protein